MQVRIYLYSIPLEASREIGRGPTKSKATELKEFILSFIVVD